MNAKLKIAAIGGGTGLSTILKGLKLKTTDLTAIVSVADDGGSSGRLRRDYGMLPPGDIRNCISALADAKPELSNFLNFRFEEGSLCGHAMGNLILAAFHEMSPNFEAAVHTMCKVFDVTGQVFPVTNETITLSARLDNGQVIRGESNIGMPRTDDTAIDCVYLNPQRPAAVEGVIKALTEADIIVLGPGSLYTSIIPNLLVEGVCDAIQSSKARKIYVCNVMTQPGETDGYTVYDHLAAIEKHSYQGIVDFVLANNQNIPEPMEARYAEEGAQIVKIDEERFAGSTTTLVRGNLIVIQDKYIRHNFSRLARAIVMLGNQKK